MRKKIKLKFQNGISFETGVAEILSYVSHLYDFIESDDPDFIIFGPYGNDLPVKCANYQRIGYFCENIIPNMDICEWAFGVMREEDVKNSRYKRIQWHNLNPYNLIKPDDLCVGEIAENKVKFCNFIYGNKVPHREAFFKALSKYKKIDAPGRSMNNMPSFDNRFLGDTWQRKRQFLNEYKFTISFENYSFPGYQTEKLFDPMLQFSIPIYYGDPYVDKIFNTHSFVHAFDFIKPDYNKLVKFIEKKSQMDFNDMRPGHFKSLPQKIQRKIKSIGRDIKMNLEYSAKTYLKLVDRIVEIDENETIYKEMLRQPWFPANSVPPQFSTISHWQQIFG